MPARPVRYKMHEQVVIRDKGVSILNLDVFVFYILFYALLFLHFDSVFGTKTKGDDRIACIGCSMLNLGK